MEKNMTLKSNTTVINLQKKSKHVRSLIIYVNARSSRLNFMLYKKTVHMRTKINLRRMKNYYQHLLKYAIIVMTITVVS